MPPILTDTDIVQALLAGFQRLAAGELGYRLPAGPAAAEPEAAAAAAFNALAAAFEREVRARETADQRLYRSLDVISDALLEVGRGNLEVHITRDYQGDPVDILAFLVDTTISELRVLEAENKRRNADELEAVIRQLRDSELRLNQSLDVISDALLEVGRGNLDVRIPRDYQGDPIDIMAYLVDTTISELRVLEADKRDRQAQIQAELEAQVAEATRELRAAHVRLQQDFNEMEALRRQLFEQTIRDPLTNLHNRRYLQEALPREITRARREQAPVSVVAIDLDHFKQLNDAYGHPGGDVMLQALSALLQAHIRGADLACRFGGEEFVLVLPGASLADAQQRAEKLRQAFGSLRVNYSDGVLHTTFSAGVASFPEHGDTGDSVLLNADRALYAAKRAGRNQVLSWPVP